MNNLDNYRIKRRDKRNIVIQKWISEKSGWVTQSYHGNSHYSLISGLFELIMAKHTPENEKLSGALVEMRKELVSGIEEAKKMIKEWGEGARDEKIKEARKQRVEARDLEGLSTFVDEYFD